MFETQWAVSLWKGTARGRRILTETESLRCSMLMMIRVQKLIILACIHICSGFTARLVTHPPPPPPRLQTKPRFVHLCRHSSLPLNLTDKLQCEATHKITQNYPESILTHNKAFLLGVVLLLDHQVNFILFN